MIIVEGAIRQHGGVELNAETMSAAEVMRGVAIYRQLMERGGDLDRPQNPNPKTPKPHQMI